MIFLGEMPSCELSAVENNPEGYEISICIEFTIQSYTINGMEPKGYIKDNLIIRANS